MHAKCAGVQQRIDAQAASPLLTMSHWCASAHAVEDASFARTVISGVTPAIIETIEGTSFLTSTYIHTI